MKETEITIQRMTPVGNARGSFVLADAIFRDSAAFTEKEMSTLKTMISNLSENGFLKVYELIEYKEIFVDRNYSQNAKKVIVNRKDRNRIVYADNFYEWLKDGRDLEGTVSMYLDDRKPECFSWGNSECVNDLIEWFTENIYSNVAYIETIPNLLSTHLSKEVAEGVLQSYDGYYPEKMEVKERTLYGSEFESLFKLLSLLNL